jgi:hypothetical protein
MPYSLPARYYSDLVTGWWGEEKTLQHLRHGTSFREIPRSKIRSTVRRQLMMRCRLFVKMLDTMDSDVILLTFHSMPNRHRRAI